MRNVRLECHHSVDRKLGYMSRVCANNLHKFVILGSLSYSYIWRCASMLAPVFVLSEIDLDRWQHTRCFQSSYMAMVKGLYHRLLFLSFSRKRMYCKSNTHPNMMRCPLYMSKYPSCTACLPCGDGGMCVYHGSMYFQRFIRAEVASTFWNSLYILMPLNFLG